MKYALLILSFCFVAFCLRGQQPDSRYTMSSVADTLQSMAGSVHIDSLGKLSGKKPLNVDQHISNLQYDSDHPENVPWKQSDLSADDVKDVLESSNPLEVDPQATDIDRLKSNNPDMELPLADAESLKKEIEKFSTSMREEKFGKRTRVYDSLYRLKSKLEMFNLQRELLEAKRIYSDKYIAKLYDSLGLRKADSIFQVVKKYSKTEIPKEDLLSRLNADMNKVPQNDGLSYDKETGNVEFDDAEKLTSITDESSKLKEERLAMLTQKDLSDVQLPVEELMELPPLPGLQMDAKKLPIVDSLREMAMKAKNIRLDEDQLTDEIKRTSFKKNLSFFDKSYIEGILGFINDSTFTIVQISPSLAYHFTNDLSLGLGPVLSVEYQQKKINAVVGFRSFIKGEFWRQRAYLQFEDNARSVASRIEDIRMLQHSLLAGGGGLIPLSEKLAVNVGVFYRVNQGRLQSGGSPWVFRIGLSSIKNIRH